MIALLRLTVMLLVMCSVCLSHTVNGVWCWAMSQIMLLVRRDCWLRKLVSSSPIALRSWSSLILWFTCVVESSSSLGLIMSWLRTRRVNFLSLCTWLGSSCRDLDFNWFSRRGYGKSSGSSGSSTPHPTSGTLTPKTEELFDAAEEKGSVQDNFLLSEKLRQRTSFSKPRLVPPTLVKLSSGKGLSVEHQERGKVKREVYKEYIKAATVTGCIFFLLSIIAQQATSVFATFTLRYWGEHNREQGSNDGMFTYLLFYGLFSLSSCLLGGVSSILMWVLCALRSAKRLHDSVGGFFVVGWYIFPEFREL